MDAEPSILRGCGIVREQLTRGRMVLVLEGGIPGGLSIVEADLPPVNVAKRPFEFGDSTRRRLYGD